MKLATYQSETGPRAGAVADNHIIDLAAALDASGCGPASLATTTQSLLAAGPKGMHAAEAAVAWHLRSGSETPNFSLTDVQLLAPLDGRAHV